MRTDKKRSLLKRRRWRIRKKSEWDRKSAANECADDSQEYLRTIR